jgi:5,10-methylenetetrahydromethanopterin reductase
MSQPQVQFGLVLQAVDSPAEFRERVRAVEAGGFTHLWLTDSSLHARDCYAYLTLAALESRALRLGTAVTHPYSRHPAANLVAITTLDELSGGRALYGIGAGDRPVTELGLTPAPVGVVREMVDISRRLLSGETVTWEGRASRLDDATLRFARRPDLPIYLAASGPRMLELTGEVADGGLILAGQDEQSLRYVQDHIAHGAQRAGRDPATVELFHMLYGSLNADRQLARDESRTMAAWFAQTAPQYAELAGFDAALVARIRDAYSGSEFHHAQNAAALCPDAMVDQLTFANTPETAVARLEQLIALGARRFNLFPMGQDRWQTIQLFIERVIPAFR